MVPRFGNWSRYERSALRALTAELGEAAGLTQRELTARMGTSQAAVARLEAGGTGATLTTLQKVGSAMNLKVTVDLTPAV